jgi:hypothetical protein
MPSSAVLGYNVDFAIYNGSTYTQLAEVTSITWPGYKRDAIDVTYMDSADQFREFIPGLMDAGEATVEINWIPSNSDVIIAALTAATVGQFKISYGTGANIVFKAIVTSYEMQSSVGEKLSATATFKVTGKPTWAAS